MREQNNLTEVIRALFKWRKLIIITTLIAAAGSAVVSLLLPNYYKSTEIFYPYSLRSLDPIHIISAESPEVFGGNSDIERLRQIGLSNNLIQFMIQKFDLYKKYGIDSNNAQGKYYVIDEFLNNYSIVKNDMGALEVTVLDKDPVTAAVMTSQAVAYIDSVNRLSIVTNNSRFFPALKASLDRKYKELEKAEIARLDPENKEQLLKDFLPNAIVKSGKITNFDAKLMEKVLWTVDLQEKYEQIQSYLDTRFSTIFIIEKARPALIKAKPIRFLIVLGSTFLVFFLTLIGILLWEYYQNNIRSILADAK